MARATDPVAQHRRDVWLYMVLPVVGVGVLLLLMLVGLFTLVVAGTWSAEQIETVASVLMIICVLTPLVVVMLALNALAVVIAVGAGKVPAFLQPLLETSRTMVARIAGLVQRTGDTSARPFISMTARWTRWENFVRALFRSTSPQADTTQERQKVDE